MLETIKAYLFECRFIIVVAVAAIIYAWKEWEKTKGILYALMLDAKSLAKDAVLKSGQQQEDWVVQMAMRYLPLHMLVILGGEEEIRKTVKWLFKKAKDLLDDGKLNNSWRG